MTNRTSIYIKNKYTKIYFQIINSAKSTNIIGYTEKHHIIPRSLGGSDDKSNLVKLTARQHYICHLLLTKMVEIDTPAYHKMIKAYMMMAWCKDAKDEPYKVNSRLFESLRIKYCELQTTKNKPFPELIAERVVIENECMIWQKSITSSGCPQLIYKNKNIQVHRYMYEYKNNIIIGKGYILKHKCENKMCVNPDHIYIISNKEKYKVNEDNHKKAAIKRRKVWIVNGVKYETLRDATEKTGLTISSLLKYTIDGIFDVESYRIGCKKANKKPKI